MLFVLCIVLYMRLLYLTLCLWTARTEAVARWQAVYLQRESCGTCVSHLAVTMDTHLCSFVLSRCELT